MTDVNKKSPVAPGWGRIFSGGSRGASTGACVHHASSSGRKNASLKSRRKGSAGSRRASPVSPRRRSSRGSQGKNVRPRQAERQRSKAPHEHEEEDGQARSGDQDGRQEGARHCSTRRSPTCEVHQEDRDPAPGLQDQRIHRLSGAWRRPDRRRSRSRKSRASSSSCSSSTSIKDKMTLRVPTAKIASVGMRKLAEAPMVQARARDAQGPRPRQAHHVVAPRPGIRGQDQFGRPHRHRRGGARPVPLGRPSRSSPTPSASSTRRRSTGCRARSRRCSGSPRPRRSRRSRRRSPRVRAAGRSPRREEAVVEEEAA